MTPGPGVEPGPNCLEASALTTAPSLLPKKENSFYNEGEVFWEILLLKNKVVSLPLTSSSCTPPLALAGGSTTGGEGIIQNFLQGVSMGKRYIIVFCVVSHLDRCIKKEWNGNCNVLYVPKKKAIYS